MTYLFLDVLNGDDLNEKQIFSTWSGHTQNSSCWPLDLCHIWSGIDLNMDTIDWFQGEYWYRMDTSMMKSLLLFKVSLPYVLQITRVSSQNSCWYMQESKYQIVLLIYFWPLECLQSKCRLSFKHNLFNYPINAVLKKKSYCSSKMYT